MLGPIPGFPLHDGGDGSQHYWWGYTPRLLKDCRNLNRITGMTPVERARALAPIHSEADAEQDNHAWELEDIGYQLAIAGLTEGETIEVAVFGDLTLVLDGGLRINVNSQVLITKCKFFTRMLESKMREGRFIPNRLNPPDVELSEDKVDTVLRLCKILHGVYDVRKDKALRKPAACELRERASASRIEARARKALVDLAQLVHKWHCYDTGSLLPDELQNWTVTIHTGWNLSAAATWFFFLEDRQNFAEATAQIVAGWDSNIEKKMRGPLEKSGVVSEVAWPDLFDGDDFYYLVKDAAEAATARFLDNLELIAQHFLSERESWHVNYGGYVAGDKPHDEQWQGLGPPDWLLQNIRDWYRDWKLTDDYLPGTEEDPDRTSPMIRSEGTSNMYAPPLLRMIRQITDLNENVFRQPDSHRRHERSWLCPRQCQAPQGNGSNSPACYKNRAWLPHGLYLKSNDGYRHFMYFYDCIRWAIDDVATLIDRGICLQHARSGTIHNGGKCFAFPCWKENVLAFNTRWTQWPTSEDDDLWDVYDF